MEPRTPLLHAIGNAHIDPVWLWRWPEGLETIRATFRSALDRMNEYPEFIFTGSSAAFYAMLADADPGMLQEIAARVREGRWEIVGGWWVQPDANVPGGESLVRQGLYGQRYFERTFGVTATVGYNPDTFGHAGTLPQILRGCGITRYVFMRPDAGEKDLPGHVFLWESPDGSRVLTARIGGGYASWGDQLLPDIERFHAARPPYLSDYLVMYGVGNHGGGPTKRNIESLLELGEREGEPLVRMSTLGAMFASQEAELAAGAEAPVVADELQHHARGCYTAHSGIKKQNRRLEHLLMNAERCASAAWFLFNRAYPGEPFARAWEAVLFNQFHDALAGTSLPEAYEDARDGYGLAASTAAVALNGSMQTITGRIDTRGAGDPMVLVNPLPWDIRVPMEVERGTGWMADNDGNPVPAQSIQPTTSTGLIRSCFVIDLPALGYRTMRQVPASEPVTSGRQLDAGEASLENEAWRLQLDPASGQIASLFDKRAGVEVMAGGGNALVVLDDQSDTWGHAVVKYRDEIGRFGDAKIALEENGPVRACLRVETTWGASSAIQRIYLYRDIDTIELRLSVDWRENYRMLKLAFPTAVRDARAHYDLPYGCIERPANGNEEPGQQWVAAQGVVDAACGGAAPYGVALLNDCKYGFDVLGGEIRMSVLRSPAFGHHHPTPLKPEYLHEYQDQGIQNIACRLIPYAGDWRDAALSRRSWELNAQPLWVFEYQHEGALPASASFLAASPENIVLSVCKKAEDGDALIVRAYEAAGRATTARIELRGCGIAWDAAFKPHEIRSWRIDRSGCATPVAVDMLEHPLPA